MRLAGLGRHRRGMTNDDLRRAIRRSKLSSASTRPTAAATSTPSLAELADDVDWAAEAASSSAPWYGASAARPRSPGSSRIASSVDVTEFTVSR